jgi:hypothetical protein
MSNETLFYICGITLAISAVVTSFIGLKNKDFPGKAMPIVVLWFAIFVVGSATFAVLHAKDEDAAKAAEFKEADKKAEEEGAQGGDSEQAEEEVEGGQGLQEEGEVGPEEEGGKLEEPGGAGGEESESGSESGGEAESEAE